MTPQKRMEEKLKSLNIAFLEIEVYGRQIIVTAQNSSEIAEWYEVLTKFATFKNQKLVFDDEKGGKVHRIYVEV